MNPTIRVDRSIPGVRVVTERKLEEVERSSLSHRMPAPPYDERVRFHPYTYVYFVPS